MTNMGLKITELNPLFSSSVGKATHRPRSTRELFIGYKKQISVGIFQMYVSLPVKNTDHNLRDLLQGPKFD